MEHTQKWIARHENDKHWIEDADHIPIANIFDSGEEGKAKAEFIVRACNSYEDLIRALKIIADSGGVLTGADASVFIQIAQRAISKAERKEI